MFATVVTLFGVSGNVDASVKKEHKPNVEGFLETPSKANGKSIDGGNAVASGTAISATTSAYLSSGRVNTWGSTTTSQTVPDIRVANYLYKGDSLINWKRDKRLGTFAYANAGSTIYVSGNYYHGSSHHYVMDDWGQAWSDTTIDSDL